MTGQKGDKGIAKIENEQRQLAHTRHLGRINRSKTEKGVMEVSLYCNKEERSNAYCNEQYLISRVHTIKLLREVASGKQRRITEWVS